jgi:hypothetical protein
MLQPVAVIAARAYARASLVSYYRYGLSFGLPGGAA